MDDMLELGDEMQAELVGGTPDFMWRCRREVGFRVEMSEEPWILCGGSPSAPHKIQGSGDIVTRSPNCRRHRNTKSGVPEASGVQHFVPQQLPVTLQSSRPQLLTPEWSKKTRILAPGFSVGYQAVM